MVTRPHLALTLTLLSLLGSATAQNPSKAERFEATPQALVDAESRYWQRVALPIPDDIVLEVSGILAVSPRRLLVTTRHGELWWIDGAYEDDPHPRFTLFASGLHEPLGIAADLKGGYYVAQRGEITRLADKDGDGRADEFRTVWKIPLSGSYHEYAFGPVIGPDGHLRVTLNVAFGVATQSPVPWRGWMIDLTPDGRMTPIAAGLRSPAGFTVTSHGDWLYAENQGEWVGSGYVAQVEPGAFFGHPASLAWSDLPGSPVHLRIADIPDSGEPKHEVAKRVVGLKTPAVWFPHTILGISTSDIREDLTRGRFGPYAGQFYIGDQGQSKVMRMTLEKVRGVWQGAAYPMQSGFESGVLRLTWGEDGSLFVGETNRGWGSIGQKPFALERVRWRGVTPFEVKDIHARADGFELTFTQPVDRRSASDPSAYRIAGFTYKYHRTYGSPPINHLAAEIRKVTVSPDGRSVRIAAACLREGYIHEIRALGVRAAWNHEALLHDTAYYTLNRLPAGPQLGGHCVAAVNAAVAASSPKHPTTLPADWPDAQGDRTILLGTKPGLAFDTPLITAKAGERLRLVFRNSDDMLHNFVLTAPGQGQVVAAAAAALGLEGPASHYIPERDDILYHTTLLEPGTSDTLFFRTPSTPGDYDFLCSFPGHYPSMRGILRVERP